MSTCHRLHFFKLGLVIIFSVVSIPHSRASPRCPYKCKCSTTSITCSDQELTEVPDFKKIMSDPTTIDISLNDIEEIKEVSFNYKKLELLISLKLHDNTIYFIQVMAFSTLTKLQRLDLSNNLLEEFSNDLIVHNKELKELNLAGNLFGTKTPEITSDSLEVLDLSFSKLSHFTKENVDGLPNLRFLYLQANNLKELDYNILGENLQFIDLAFNSWKCQCETIQMLDHLIKNNRTVVTSPVQCIHSFRRYEDVYDSYGPVNSSKWCDKNLNLPSVSNNTQTTYRSLETNSSSNYMHIEYKIWIGVGIIILVVLIFGVILTVIWTKQNRVKRNLQSKNTNYREVPTKNLFITPKETSKNNYMYVMNQVTL